MSRFAPILPLLILTALSALRCSSDTSTPERRPAEQIVSRLVEQLDEAQIELGPIGAGSNAQRELDRWTGTGRLSPAWVALDSDGRPPRSERHDDQLLLTESACAVFEVDAKRDLSLHVEMAPEPAVEDRIPSRLLGEPVVVELDRPPPSNAVGCRTHYLIRHGLMPRRAEDGQVEPAEGDLRSFDISFTTMAQTRAVAVVLATGLEINFGLRTRVSQREGARARLGEVRTVLHGVEGVSLERFREHHPPDPLLDPSPHRLLGKPSLEHQRRDAILAPPGTTVCFTLEIPARASLRFAPGIAWNQSATPGRPVTFRVRGGDRTLHEETRGPDQLGWSDRRVSLEGLEGRQEICLETEAPDGPGVLWSLWGTPELTALSEPDEPLPPTVVLVSIDTLRADRLGAYGYTPATSPVLDELAREGVVYEHHVAQTGWTLPSHVSMLTGLAPEAHGVTGQMDRILDLLEVGFDPTVPTLAAAMRRAGYSTHGIVSAPYLDPSFGFDRGFDTYDASTVSSHLESHRDITAPRLTRLSRQLVGRSGRRPLFLFLHFWDVHYDYIPPPEDLAEVHPHRARQRIDYRLVRHPFTRHIDPALIHLVATAGPDRSPPEFYRRIRHLLPRYRRVHAFMGLLSDLYDGEIRTVDRHLGLLFAELERRGRDDAVIVITGDHGESFMEHGTLGHGVDNIYSEGLEVPLIIRAPGRLEPGRRSRPSNTVDISATLLELIGLDPLTGAQGHDLTSDEERLVVGHDGSFSRVQATLGHHRLLVWGYFGPDQLYDIEEDPGELVELGERLSDRRDELRRQVARYLLTHGRGVHVSLVGDEHQEIVEIVLESDEPLQPAFAYGPPDTGELSWASEGHQLRLQASQTEGEIIALTIMTSDEARISAAVTRGGAPVPLDRITVGDGHQPTSTQADESWNLPVDTLPDGLGETPGRVYFWRTPAFTVREPLTPEQDTFEQLRALGYLHGGTPPASAGGPGAGDADVRSGSSPDGAPPARADR